ncbi:3'-5' exoribonuclease YhaM family protein [Vulgatibacter sp.]|uniref:3'-5' exoribonuclease YhaM family protein n=1 Tax=Vulgatibacter sp. TaxID=1971226 RepID=UPI00356444CF
MDKLWVKDVEEGQRASSVFLVAKKQQATGRNGKTFLKLLLQDKTGHLDARVWHDAETVGATFEQGDFVEAEGQVESFQGKPQLTVERLAKTGEQDRAEFDYNAPEAPAAPQREEPRRGGVGEAAVQQLRQELARVGDPHVRALLLSFIDDPEIGPRLKRAPAAKEIHHAHPGGLADHMLSCVRLAQRLADQYPMVDRDLLVAGAFLHDLGKVNELSYDKGGTGYTDEGRLVGHLVMTAQWIHERAKTIGGFPRELELHLTHIVLAHHGRLEYGSPKLPMTIEAFLVHELDEIDSRVNSWLSHMARSPGERWAEPTKGYESLLWKGAMPTEEGRRQGPAWKQLRRGKGEKKKRERGERQQVSAAEAALVPGENVPAPGPERRERRERPAREERAPREAAQREGGAERRGPGPKILKRAEGGAPRGGEAKLTFKPFSALTEEPETPGAEGELTPMPVETGAGAEESVMAQPEAATTESLPETGPEETPARLEPEGNA